MATTKARVRWTDEERARFYEAARSLGPPDGNDTQHIWTQAQQVAGFTPSRMRPFTSTDAAKMNKERRKGRPATAARDAAVEQAVQAAQNDGIPAARIVPQGPISVEPPPQPEVIPDLRALAAETISDVVLRVLYDPRIRAALRSIVAETLAPETELEATQALSWRKANTPRERRWRVVVVGGGGKADVNTLLGIPGVDVRHFADDGESLHRLKAIIAGADEAVIATKSVSHKAQTMVQARAKSWRYWNGAFNEMRADLEQRSKQQMEGV